jgi:BolA protein
MTKLGTVGQSLERKLKAAFAPDTLDIEDESARHAGHSGARDGGESHFRVRIVSSAFKGMTRVERQRRIYAALAEEFAQGLHALSLNAQTPEEMSQTPKMR